MTENEVSKVIVDSCFEVHKTMGPGLLESVYKKCLYYELVDRGLKVEVEKRLPLKYKTRELGYGFRLDLWVEDKVIVELKTVDVIHDIHLAQILTYLRLSNLKLGFIVNFKTPLIKDGLKRVINGRLEP